MSRTIIGPWLASGLLAALVVPAAEAQGPYTPAGVNPALRPAVSPWINMFRRGNSPAINYYGLVRPEFTFRNSIQELGQQQTTLTSQQQQLETALTLPPTGRGSGFLNHGKYFQRRGTIGAVTTAPAAPTAAAAAAELRTALESRATRPPSGTTSPSRRGR
jgi:hypothetical protein